MEPLCIKDIINSVNIPSHYLQKEDNIMMIAGIDHLENAWSRIYAYFLDEKKPHGLGDLFKKSLESVIYRKIGRSVNISGGVVKCEHSTIDGNRIDILIQAPEHTVIIENKVHHHLNNDLDDYWISINGNNDTKIGIVVTLSKILTNNLNYINVTHLEWVNEIEKLLISHKNRTGTKDAMVLLNNFLENIKRVCGKMNESDIKFYLSNRENINNLYSIASDYRSWLQSIFTDKAFIRSLGGFTLVHNDWVGCKNRFAMYRFSNTTEKDELVVTIFYETLWNSKPGEARLSLFLQVLGDWENKAIYEENSIREIARDSGVPSKERHKDFWHCAAVEIPIPDDELLSEDALKGYIIKHLTGNIPNKGLLTAANRIIELLSNEHLPTYQWSDAMKHLKNNITKEQFETVRWLEFVLYDAQRNIVLLEVVDSFLRDRIEFEFHNQISNAIHYAFGEGSRFAIMYRCRLD